jgi:fatty acid desaturase
LLLETQLAFQYPLTMMSVDRSKPDHDEVRARGEKTLVRAAGREAALALSIWLVAMLYTVIYCYLNGYGRSVESLTFVWWFPDWVFWGIVLPWGICVLLSTVFALAVMGGESLGEEIDADPAASVRADGEVRHE